MTNSRPSLNDAKQKLLEAVTQLLRRLAAKFRATFRSYIKLAIVRLAVSGWISYESADRLIQRWELKHD